MSGVIFPHRFRTGQGVTPQARDRTGLILHTCFADRRGSSGVEFALLLPCLTVLLMGIFDYGSLAYATMQVHAAAHAGADYALHNGWSASGVQAAVTSATTLTVSATPAPALSKACVVNGVIVATAGTSCASGGSPGSYVMVNARASFSPLAVWSKFVLPSTITAQATVRIQ